MDDVELRRLGNFLHARYDAVEASQRPESPGRWHAGTCPMLSDDVCGCGVPEIVLADVDMKRQLVREASVVPLVAGWILPRLAGEFRDHPEWRSEWATVESPPT